MMSDKALPAYTPDKAPPVGTPGTAHRVYIYDRTHERVIFGGAAYVLNDKGGTLTDPDMSVLYERDLATGTTRRVVSLPGRELGIYSVSPDGRYIALRSWAYGDLGTMTLHVIDPGGHELARIGQVWDYAWSPDGNQLVYVTGDYRVGQDGVPSTGVWKYDLRQRTSIKIHDTGRYVTWGAFDRAVYLLDYATPSGHPRVWRLNPTDWSPQLTRLKSIYLSPTGMYYYHPGPTVVNQGQFDVYDVATHTPRFLPPSDLSRRFAWGTEPIGWIESGGNQLLFLTWSNPDTGQLDSQPHTMLYDLDAGTIVDTGAEDVIGWKQGALITSRQGKIQTEQPGKSRFQGSAPR